MLHERVRDGAAEKVRVREHGERQSGRPGERVQRWLDARLFDQRAKQSGELFAQRGFAPQALARSLPPLGLTHHARHRRSANHFNCFHIEEKKISHNNNVSIQIATKCLES